ncbi:ABC transporter ATP-binding protein [Kitasatospora sp. NPDC058965]|uniref:ABC transporter ATP-binding protein n=1 Tax=Kitasatospora sp. NPDC058965 TaxID=3346682 RepID=UPI00367DBA80
MTKNSGGSRTAVALTDVTKTYRRAGEQVTALDRVSLAIPSGSFTAVMGPSGSGKSTFLHCAAGLDTPSTGRVELGGTELSGMNERALTELRRSRVGFVFQSYNLIDSLTVRQNIELPLRLTGRRSDRGRVTEICRRVGLAGRERRRPAELSGGQQQRVAIARALAARPAVIFGDEPTGALDPVTADQILTLLRQSVDEDGQTVVMVTHDPVAAGYADTVVYLAGGRLAGTNTAPTARAVAADLAELAAGGAWV